MLDAAAGRFQSLQSVGAALLPVDHQLRTMLLGISDIERVNLAGFEVTDSADASPDAGLVALQVHIVIADHMGRAKGAGKVRSDGNRDWRDWSALGSRMDGVGPGSSLMSVSSSGHGWNGR